MNIHAHHAVRHLRAAGLGLLAALLLSGCALAPASTESEDEAQVLSLPGDSAEVVQARQVLLRLLEQTPLVRHVTFNLKPGEARYIDYTNPETNGRQSVSLFLLLPNSIGVSYSPGNAYTYAAWKVSYTDYSDDKQYFWLSSSWSQADANEAARALRILVLDARQEFDQRIAKFYAEFQQQCGGWRALKDKPPMPETARQHWVLAQAAEQQHDMDKAADEYYNALDIYPCWPQGLYRRAQLMGDARLYPIAIANLNRYLFLVPEAPDAQALRDKILIWQDRMGR